MDLWVILWKHKNGMTKRWMITNAGMFYKLTDAQKYLDYRQKSNFDNVFDFKLCKLEEVAEVTK